MRNKKGLLKKQLQRQRSISLHKTLCCQKHSNLFPLIHHRLYIVTPVVSFNCFEKNVFELNAMNRKFHVVVLANYGI